MLLSVEADADIIRTGFLLAQLPSFLDEHQHLFPSECATADRTNVSDSAAHVERPARDVLSCDALESLGHSQNRSAASAVHRKQAYPISGLQMNQERGCSHLLSLRISLSACLAISGTETGV